MSPAKTRTRRRTPGPPTTFAEEDALRADILKRLQAKIEQLRAAGCPECPTCGAFNFSPEAWAERRADRT